MYSSSFSNKLVFFFLASLFLFTFSNSLVNGESDKLQVNLYYESLCPYCQTFIVDDLVKLFDTDFEKITDVKLVPYGNAHILDNQTITCQHGEEECNLNALEACVIRTYPDPKDHFKHIRCIESDTKDWKKSCVMDSAAKNDINDCYNSDISKKLILGYANETMSLEPPHKFVPWLTVNGRPLEEKFVDFVAIICKAYKGKEALPKACSASALYASKVSKLQVSYVNEAINY